MGSHGRIFNRMQEDTMRFKFQKDYLNKMKDLSEEGGTESWEVQNQRASGFGVW